MTRRGDVRPRAAMLASAIALMRERGVAATSFADVLAHSGAPRGSIYHHFPGGKAQLVQEATQAAADYLTEEVNRVLAAGDTASALRALVGLWRRGLEERDYAAGCPVVAAALGTDEGARELSGEAFARWTKSVAQSLVKDGVPEARAESLGVLVVSALEGALVMAQAQGSSAPLDEVVDELETLCG